MFVCELISIIFDPKWIPKAAQFWAPKTGPRFWISCVNIQGHPGWSLKLEPKFRSHFWAQLRRFFHTREARSGFHSSSLRVKQISRMLARQRRKTDQSRSAPLTARAHRRKINTSTTPTRPGHSRDAPSRGQGSAGQPALRGWTTLDCVCLCPSCNPASHPPCAPFTQAYRGPLCCPWMIMPFALYAPACEFAPELRELCAFSTKHSLHGPRCTCLRRTLLSGFPTSSSS